MTESDAPTIAMFPDACRSCGRPCRCYGPRVVAQCDTCVDLDAAIEGHIAKAWALAAGVRAPYNSLLHENASNPLLKLRRTICGDAKNDAWRATLPNEPRAFRVARRAERTVLNEDARLVWETSNVLRDRLRVVCAAARILWRFREQWRSFGAPCGITVTTHCLPVTILAMPVNPDREPLIDRVKRQLVSAAARDVLRAERATILRPAIERTEGQSVLTAVDAGLVERYRRLVALAASPNEHEAASAGKEAARLASDHALASTSLGSNLPGWGAALLGVIARHLFTEGSIAEPTWAHRADGTWVTIAGSRSAVLRARVLWAGAHAVIAMGMWAAHLVGEAADAFALAAVGAFGRNLADLRAFRTPPAALVMWSQPDESPSTGPAQPWQIRRLYLVHVNAANQGDLLGGILASRLELDRHRGMS